MYSDNDEEVSNRRARIKVDELFASKGCSREEFIAAGKPLLDGIGWH